jgi:hypothetical protein
MNTALMAAQEPVFVGLGINQLDARYLQGFVQQLRNLCKSGIPTGLHRC